MAATRVHKSWNEFSETCNIHCSPEDWAFQESSERFDAGLAGRKVFHSYQASDLCCHDGKANRDRSVTKIDHLT